MLIILLIYVTNGSGFPSPYFSSRSKLGIGQHTSTHNRYPANPAISNPTAKRGQASSGVKQDPIYLDMIRSPIWEALALPARGGGLLCAVDIYYL